MPGESLLNLANANRLVTLSISSKGQWMCNTQQGEMERLSFRRSQTGEQSPCKIFSALQTAAVLQAPMLTGFQQPPKMSQAVLT